MFTILRRLILATACLLFAVSVTLLGLICHSLAYKDSSTAQNSVTVVSNGTIQNTFAYLPASLNSGSYWIIFAAGLGGTLDAPLVILCALRRSPIRWKTHSFRAFDAVIVVLSLLRIGVGIAAMAYSFIEFNNSSVFDLSAIPGDGKRYPGRFTLEAFNCHLKDYASSGEASRFSQWCREGTAARWLLVPYIVLSVCIFLLSSYTIWKEKEQKAMGITQETIRQDASEEQGQTRY